MALSEEDYLDKLLKSVTSGEDSSMQEEEVEVASDLDELVEAETVAQEPETFDNTEESEELENTMGIDGSMSIDEFMNAMVANSERYEDETSIENVISEEEITENLEVDNIDEVLENDFDSALVDDFENAADEESEDDLVDEYIKKVLSLGNDDITETENEIDSQESEVQEKENEHVNLENNITDNMVEGDFEEETHYVDITDDEFFDADDLISQLDSIVSDSAMELEDEQSNEKELQVDDELKELLGMNDGQEIVDEQEFVGLSEEDLMRIASIEEEVSQEDIMPDKAEIAQEVDGPEDDEKEELAELLGLLAENGIDIDDNVEQESFADEPKTDVINNDIEKDISKKNTKESFLTKLLAVFKKKEKKPDTSESGNENQKVLDELFDENGELLGENKKPKKKGLFSKPIKVSDNMVEITGKDLAEADFEMPEFDNVFESNEEATTDNKSKKKKEKVKKEKPKKEKVKKPKKAPKPKVKKEKKPVAPHEIITVKPGGVFVMIIFVAIISCAAYFFPRVFSYNQAFDTATYYLVDKKYTFAYEAIAGIEPTAEEDVALVEQIETIMMVQKQYNSYERYAKMSLHFEALDALIKGIGKYDEHVNKAVEIGVGDDLENVRALIVNTLWQQYGITEDMARSYGLITDYEQYVYILESYGGRIDDSNN